MTTHTLVPRRLGLRTLRPAMAPWNDWSALDRLFDEFWRDFGVSGSGSAERAIAFAPRIDVEETDAELRVSAELPGLEEKDFEVRLDSDVLTIKGERRDEHAQEGEGYRHRETVRGSFHRALRLPFEPDAEALKASYRQGVLTVTIPKPEEARPQVRTIPVTTS